MKQELETLGAADHSNITKILQTLEDDETVYIVMELVKDKDILA